MAVRSSFLKATLSAPTVTLMIFFSCFLSQWLTCQNLQAWRDVSSFRSRFLLGVIITSRAISGMLHLDSKLRVYGKRWICYSLWHGQ